MPTTRVMRLACPNFQSDEATALRSLFQLISKHLRQPWEIVEGGDADLLLVNLDTGWSPERPPAAPVVGCALRPRQFPRGTLHRPLRVAELLALLSECGEQASVPGAGSGVAADASCAARAERRWRLVAWPDEFEQWPAEWRGVLAAMSHVARSAREISRRTGVAPEEVERCLALLDRQGLLSEPAASAGAAAVPRTPPGPGRWQGLATRVGQLLGFGR